MSTKSKVSCDMCGTVFTEEWEPKRPWAKVWLGQTLQDFCVSCWNPIVKLMRRSFVDSIMLEAQGIKEETE